jgi:hypothetical protein
MWIKVSDALPEHENNVLVKVQTDYKDSVTYTYSIASHYLDDNGEFYWVDALFTEAIGYNAPDGFSVKVVAWKEVNLKDDDGLDR